MIYAIKSDRKMKEKIVNQARKAFENHRAFYDVDRNNRFVLLLSYSDILKQPMVRLELATPWLFLCWHQEFLCPVEPLFFSDEKSTTVEK